MKMIPLMKNELIEKLTRPKKFLHNVKFKLHYS